MKNNSSKAKRLVRSIAFSHIFVSFYSVWLTRICISASAFKLWWYHVSWWALENCTVHICEHESEKVKWYIITRLVLTSWMSYRAPARNCYITVWEQLIRPYKKERYLRLLQSPVLLTNNKLLAEIAFLKLWPRDGCQLNTFKNISKYFRIDTTTYIWYS